MSRHVERSVTPREAPLEPATLIDPLLLRSPSRQVRFAPGDILRRRGQHYHDMYLLLDGAVEVDLERGGHDHRIVVSKPGSPVGEIAFLRGCEATATVTALTDCRCLIITDHVLESLEDEPALAARLMRYLADTAEERSSFNLIFTSPKRTTGGAGPVEVYLCRTRDMLERAQRLRYHVYCDELGRKSPHADHERKIIADGLDAFGHTFIAMEGDEVIGTLRANIASEGPLGAYEELYGMTASAHHPAATSICTKLIVKKSRRGGPAAMKMIAAVVRFGMQRDIKECYIDCIPSLLHYYKAFGFKITGHRFFHPENGLSQAMVLDLVRHGARLSEEPGVRGYLRLFAKAQAIKLLDVLRGRRAVFRRD